MGFQTKLLRKADMSQVIDYTRVKYTSDESTLNTDNKKIK